MARTGEDQMRIRVHEICKLLVENAGLLALITDGYPTVATALAALQAACALTGFDKVPEIQP